MRSLKISLFVLLLAIVSCSQEPPPFEAEFLSRDTVVIRYNGKDYTLHQYGPRVETPFSYTFEPDGDLDLIVEGKHYEIDNPYDIDTFKKKKSKKYKKKRISKKRR